MHVEKGSWCNPGCCLVRDDVEAATYHHGVGDGIAACLFGELVVIATIGAITWLYVTVCNNFAAAVARAVKP